MSVVCDMRSGDKAEKNLTSVTTKGVRRTETDLTSDKIAQPQQAQEAWKRSESKAINVVIPVRGIMDECDSM